MSPSAWIGLAIVATAVIVFLLIARSNRGKDRSNIPTRSDVGGGANTGAGPNSTKG